jgi:hypothetical protein
MSDRELTEDEIAQLAKPPLPPPEPVAFWPPETQLDRIERKVDDLSKALLEIAKGPIARGSL